MTKAGIVVTKSSIPLGSKFETHESPLRKNMQLKSNISTRDNLNTKVVGRPQTFTNGHKKRVEARGTADHVSEVLGEKKASPTTTANKVTATTSTETKGAGDVKGIGEQQGDLSLGARKKKIAPAPKILSTAALGGDTEIDATANVPSSGPPNGTIFTTHHRKLFKNASAESGVLPTSAHVPNISVHVDPNDTRFVGAAGAPSRSAQHPALLRPKKVSTNHSVEGAAGVRSEDVKGVFDRLHRKAVSPSRSSAGNIISNEPPAPSSTTATSPSATSTVHVGKRPVVGRSAIVGVSPSRGTRPFATSDDLVSATVAAAGGGGTGKLSNTMTLTRRRTELSAKYDASSRKSLVGVFKPDTSCIKPRECHNVAPWDSEQSQTKPATQKARVGEPSKNARKTHMGSVFAVPESIKEGTGPILTGAAVGSSNIMGRTSPYRGNVADRSTLVKTAGAPSSPNKVPAGSATAPSPSTFPQAAAGRSVTAPLSAKVDDYVAERRYRAAVVPQHQVGRDTRPVWKQTPRQDNLRPSIGGCRRQAYASPAPWATSD